MTDLYRMRHGWQAHGVFGKDAFSRRDAWSWMIDEAACEAKTVTVAQHPVTVERGQFCHSFRFMAKVWRWSIGRVQDFLAMLDEHTMIHTHKHTGRIVVTLCNYDKYQLTDRAEHTLLHTPEHTGQREKKVDKEKRDSKERNPNGFLPPLIPPHEKPTKTTKPPLVLDDDMRTWIAESTPGIDGARELAAHLDWKAANGRVYRDDRAGFRTWCRRAHAELNRHPQRNGNGHGRSSHVNGPATGIADGFAEALAQRRRRDDGDRSGDLPFDGPLLGRQ